MESPWPDHLSYSVLSSCRQTLRNVHDCPQCSKEGFWALPGGGTEGVRGQQSRNQGGRGSGLGQVRDSHCLLFPPHPSLDRESDSEHQLDGAIIDRNVLCHWQP